MSGKEIKVENSDDDSSSNTKSVAQTMSKAPLLGLPTQTFHAYIKEESPASSSWSHLKSSFVGMGFSPSLVDKVIEENGRRAAHAHTQTCIAVCINLYHLLAQSIPGFREADACVVLSAHPGEADPNLLLETLFTYSALENSSEDPPISLDDTVYPKAEESSSVDFSFSSREEIEEMDADPEVSSGKRRSLLNMDFSMEEVNHAINRIGEDASIADLVDFILASQTAGAPQENDVDGAACDGDRTEKVITNESLFGTMNKTLHLLGMGFSENDISEAIASFGSEVPVAELADSIFAKQLAQRPVKEEKDDPYKFDNPWKRNHSESEESQLGETKASSSNLRTYLTDSGITAMETGKRAQVIPSSDNNGQKRAKSMSSDDNISFLRIPKPEADGLESETSSSKEQHGWEDPKPIRPESSVLRVPKFQWNSQAGSLYFLYGNVMDISEQTWAKISQFLGHVEPEFTNAQLFSPFIRREGYIHNIPSANRSCILPRPAMTVQDALPQTMKWWPSWDPRKQLSCIRSDSTGITQICERLGKILRDSHGVLSEEQKADIIHRCKTNNLIWVGPHNLSPVEPDQLEHILGYESGHTRVWTCGSAQRLKILHNSYQTDTLGFLLSPLKLIFPDGVRLLSIFSGSGGAEVALHRLGIPLRVVVCVESSKVHQEIIRKWWNLSRQAGELLIIDDIELLRVKKMDFFVKQFGGFDLVIGGNPFGTNEKASTMGVNFPLFFEFTRVLQCLKRRIKKR